MFAYLDLSERRDYNPTYFCRSFDWEGEPVNVTIQQDSSDFLAKIFDKIENSLKATPYKTILDSVYQGSTVNWMQCQGCGYERNRSQTFYNLTLEVKYLKNIYEGFQKINALDEISDFMCDNCNEKCDIQKREFVENCPNNLVINLQRIVFDLETFFNVKVNSRYEFPFQLNIKKFTKDWFDEERRTEETETPSTLKPDEYYDYDLVGVTCHDGTADFGHYYSYINVNRNDPMRPHNANDKWLEYNDSRVFEFDMKKFEECCFGSDENTGMNDNIWSPKSGNLSRSAYILVYEKRQKGKLHFKFDEKNIGEKEDILNNFCDIEKVDPELRKPEAMQDMDMEVDFDIIKPNYHTEIYNEITKDNLQYQMQQQIYSKEFLSFITDVTTLPVLNDVIIKTSVDCLNEKYFSEKDLEFYSKLLDIEMSLFISVMSHSSENNCITRYTQNIIMLCSVAPQLAFGFFKKNFSDQFMNKIQLLMSINDSSVRKSTSKLLANL